MTGGCKICRGLSKEHQGSVSRKITLEIDVIHFRIDEIDAELPLSNETGDDELVVSPSSTRRRGGGVGSYIQLLPTLNCSNCSWW